MKEVKYNVFEEIRKTRHQLNNKYSTTREEYKSAIENIQTISKLKNTNLYKEGRGQSEIAVDPNCFSYMRTYDEIESMLINVVDNLMGYQMDDTYKKDIYPRIHTDREKVMSLIMLTDKIQEFLDTDDIEIKDFELGMINGQLSALRWVLGEYWNVLDIYYEYEEDIDEIARYEADLDKMLN